MTRHRWQPREDGVASRHKGVCLACGLLRTRAPGSHATFYEWPEGNPVDTDGRTPACVPIAAADRR